MIALALRYLLARRRQTILTLLGIGLGSTAYVTISGFMLGFRGYFITQLINNNAQVHIQAREDFLTDHLLDEPFYGKAFAHVFWNPPPSGRKDSNLVESPQSWYRRLAADPRVVAYSPQLQASVIFKNGTAIVATTIIGCDPAQQMRVTTIGDYVTMGHFEDLSVGGNRLAIGDELRKRLGVTLGQTILVSLADNPAVPFKIMAVFKTGNKLSDSFAYGALNDVQRVNQTPNQVNEIGVRLRDFRMAATVATQWAHLSSEKVESWDQQNANLFNVFRLQDAIRYLTVGATMIVAGFGIYNVLNMTVMQKRRDIAILRSMGYSKKDILWLFFAQGLILGLSGVFLGVLVGEGLCLYLRTIPFGGGPMGGGTGYLMVSTSPSIAIQSAVLALAACTLASVLPARAASKLAPIQIIREGAD